MSTHAFCHSTIADLEARVAALTAINIDESTARDAERDILLRKIEELEADLEAANIQLRKQRE